MDIVKEIKEYTEACLKDCEDGYIRAMAEIGNLDNEEKENRKRYIFLLDKKLEVGSAEHSEWVKVNTRFTKIPKEREQWRYKATRALIEIEAYKHVLEYINAERPKHEGQH